MPNFSLLNALQNINPSQGVIAKLPVVGGSDGGDDIGSLFSGLTGLVGAFRSHSNQQAGSVQNAPSSPIGGYTQRAFGIGQPLDGRSRLEQTVSQNLNDLYQRPAFQSALTAHQKAIESGATTSPIMTVVDYSLPANQPRLWTVDTLKNQVLLNTYVAQGSTPGFSNTPGSHQSSLGTFITGNTYHSQSMGRDALKINGLDKGVNDNAFQRGIVVHGGNYVGKDKQGTSWGCFTVPYEVAPNLIGLTKNGTIIHSYAPDNHSLNNFSNTLDQSGSDKLRQVINTHAGDNLVNKGPFYNSTGSQLRSAPYLPGSNSPDNSQNIFSGSKLGQHVTNSATFSNQSGYHPELQDTMAGIAGIESGGAKDPYRLTSIPSKNGDRAYGKYQIMGSNIPSWTREATGQAMSPAQFLANPEAQEKTAAYMINKQLQAGYAPEDAASIWFSGRPRSKAGNARDAYGTSVPQYVNQFKQGYLRSKSRQQDQRSPVGPTTMNTRSNPPIPTQSQPGVVPNIRAFNPNVPVENLSPQEIQAIMNNLHAQNGDNSNQFGNGINWSLLG